MKSLFMVFMFAACASDQGQLTDRAREIEVFTNKPSRCSVMGKIVGTDKMGSKELALNHALNQAAKLGASGLHVNQEVPNGNNMTVYATAYKCD